MAPRALQLRLVCCLLTGIAANRGDAIDAAPALQPGMPEFWAGEAHCAYKQSVIACDIGSTGRVDLS